MSERGVPPIFFRFPRPRSFDAPSLGLIQRLWLGWIGDLDENPLIDDKHDDLPVLQKTIYYSDFPIKMIKAKISP